MFPGFSFVCTPTGKMDTKRSFLVYPLSGNMTGNDETCFKIVCDSLQIKSLGSVILILVFKTFI